MPYIKSPLIFTSSAKGILENHIIKTNNEGKIVAIEHESKMNPHDDELIVTKEMLMPGMINAHCHMELSHMKGIIPTGTGLVEFIKQIITKRSASQEAIKSAITQAEHEMYVYGIMAVGDISNVTDSFDQKENGKLQYHTFVETFDLMQSKNTLIEYEKSLSVYDALLESERNKKSIVPHAPYSVSDELFKLINKSRNTKNSTSIHHQETDAENLFVSDRTGELVDFFEGFGLSLNDYIPNKLPASARVILNMANDQKTLLVHNTMSTPEDIQNIEAWNSYVYWVTCPNANLYIENRMPKYEYWINQKSKMCLGTDSLASNWQLSILDEMVTIQKYQSFISSEELIKWATINGAEALGFDDRLGSIEVGKTPGLVSICNFDLLNRRFNKESKASRLI